MEVEHGKVLYIVSDVSNQETEIITADRITAVHYIDKKLAEEHGMTVEMITELYKKDEVHKYYLLDQAPFKKWED